ncbi:MAG: E3 binding domain-containing protein, partial [Actinomycetota bacterium]|nr:E3 binding domain-containing protein [Actinomycetota bacterium]
MTTIKMPQLGETIVEGTILKWLKGEGEVIERDEPLFEISTDKVDTEVPSPVSGTVSKILVDEGQTVAVGTDLAEISEDGAAGGDSGAAGAAPVGGPEPAAEEASSGTSAGAEPPSEATPAPAASTEATESAAAVAEGSAAEMPAVEPATPQGAEATAAAETPAPSRTGSGGMPDRGPRSRILSPLVRRLADEHGLDLSRIEGSGTGGRITKQDVL